MSELEGRYQAVKDKLVKLGERRAVLANQEEQKAQKRTELEKELMSAEVNLDDLDGEAQRLQGEAREALTRAEELVTEFEKQLEAVTAGSTADETGDIQIG